jgi:hypothetical protein
MSNFFDGLWLKFTIITSGNVKSKYIVDNKFISIHISPLYYIEISKFQVPYFSSRDSTSGDNSSGVFSFRGLFSRDIVHNFG